MRLMIKIEHIESVEYDNYSLEVIEMRILIKSYI